MPTQPTIDWNTIRLHKGSQELGFEELCAQLFRNDPPSAGAAWERRGYRDAGLECAYVLPGGSLLGIQAKFFRTAPDKGQWAQLDKSVRTALEKNPKLSHLTICIPQNLDNPKIKGQKSAMDRWLELVDNWKRLAAERGMTIELTLWDDTELSNRLTKPQNAGKLRYFFNRQEFTSTWFSKNVDIAEANAGPRYSRQLNVKLPISDVFGGLARSEEFAANPRRLHGLLFRAARSLQVQDFPTEHATAGKDAVDLANALVRLTSMCRFWSVETLPLDEIASAAQKLSERVWDLYLNINRLDREAEQLKRAEHVANGKPDYSFHYTSPHSHLKDILRELSSIAENFEEFANSPAAKAGNIALLLVSGKAGMGKTHLFVDVAIGRSKCNYPTVLLLGQNFYEGDPWKQIITSLGLTIDRDEFLQVLEAAGEAAGCRSLILIDAINEGPGLNLWPTHLLGMITLLKSYPYIALGLSVRSTYEEAVLPESGVPELVRIVHTGFASKPEEAARAFFKFYKLNLPGVPLLNPEFTDPLFLSSLCKGLAAAGLHDIPTGYNGISKIFDLLLQAAASKLRKEQKLDEPPGRNYVREFLKKIAEVMMEDGATSVSIVKAYELSESIKPTNGYNRSLHNLLLLEGLLIKELVRDESECMSREVVAFAYQKLGDHEITRLLLDTHCSGDDPGSALLPNGSIGSLFKDSWDYYSKKGFLEALSIQVPERFGFELVEKLGAELDLSEWSTEASTLTDCFMESLMWRSADSITDNTFKVLRRIRWTSQTEDDYFGVLTMLAGTPGHPLNAERLHHILIRSRLFERDQFWTVWINKASKGDHAVDRLISWSIGSDDKSHLTDESVALVLIALTWLTASTNHRVRDSATKGVVQLLTGRAHLLSELVKNFESVDDMYVLERLYAAAYGASLRNHDVTVLAQLARTVYEAIFSGQGVIPHLNIRDYCRNIIERAVALGCDLEIDLERVRPPYGSPMPASPLTKKTLLSKRPPSGSNWTSLDRLLSHVVNRFGSLRIEEYAGGPPTNNVGFTSVSLSETMPLNERQKREQFEAQLSQKQRKAWQQLADLDFLRRFGNLTPERFGVDGITSEVERQAFTKRIHRAIAREHKRLMDIFIGSLSDEAMQNSALSLLSPRKRKTQQSIPQFDREYIPRYVSTKALRLGWTLKRFQDHDGAVEHSRSYYYGPDAFKQETIAAKYLWIGYWEILAILTDNHFLLSHDEASRYEGPWQVPDSRNIDPSFIPIDSEATTEDPPWWTPALVTSVPLATGEDWLRDTKDLQDLDRQLLVKDSGGVTWIVLTAYPRWSEPMPPEVDKYDMPSREIWCHIRANLVKVEDADRLIKWTQGKHIDENDFQTGDGYNSDVFLGEFYQSPIWQSRQEEPDWGRADWHTPHGAPCPVAYLCEGYNQPTGDASTKEPISAKIPSPLLAREGKLAWSGNFGHWKDPSGEIVVVDPSLEFGGPSALLARQDFINQLLGTDYQLFWTVVGEKQIHGGASRPHQSYQQFSDMPWYEDGRVISSRKATYHDLSSRKPKTQSSETNKEGNTGRESA